jgi:pimeloyl-ACP methyl ester carboxylesterase
MRLFLVSVLSVFSSAYAAGVPALPSLNWGACSATEQFPAGVDCATARVPLDYDQPAGDSIDLALARRPATNSQNRLGTIFVNPGGPGGSGVDLAAFGFGEFIFDKLQGRFDVVGFDPRGIARSEPLRCFDTLDEAFQLFAGVPVFPYRAELQQPYFDIGKTFATQCINRQSRIFDHMSTADVVRDLDLLRQAVGDSKLTYLGFSYGSYIGNTYAILFPGNVRAVVIDGVLDPRLWANGLQVSSDRVATEEEFQEFLRLCDEAGAPACALAGPGGSSNRFATLEAAVRTNPPTLPDGTVYTIDLLIRDAAFAMYAPENWVQNAAFFAALLETVTANPASAARAGELRTRIIQTIENWRGDLQNPRREARLQGSPRAQEQYSNFLEGFPGNHCSDTQYPKRLPAYTVVDLYARAGSRFGPFWWWSNANCANWPLSEDRYGGPWITRTSAPVLVVGNFFDGITDYAGAVASSRLLTNSRLLSYAGWGHTATGRSACVADFVAGYLLNGTLPPEGTVCPANPSPFSTTPSDGARSSRSARGPMVGLPPRTVGR